MKMNTKKNSKAIIAVGYIRKDADAFTAICVNMNLFAQAVSAEKAFEKVVHSIVDYVNYIKEQHPKDWESYLYQPADQEFRTEFINVLNEMKRLTESRASRRPHKRLTEHIHLPVRSFAEQISVANA